MTPDEPSPDADAAVRVRAWIAECIDRFEAEGAAAIEAVCAAHPEDEPAIRAQVARLAQIGLLRRFDGRDDGGDGGDGDRFPERLGDFRLIRRLGGGGMGLVYLAEQTSLGRLVALKVVRSSELYVGHARERFRREAQLVATLRHPGIVPVHAFGEEGGVPFYAMEFVDGANLDELLKRLAGRDPATLSGADVESALATITAERAATPDRPAPVRLGASAQLGWVPFCLTLVRQVAEALAHAHESGVVHRDLKPSNLMVARDGRVQLVDFGLSTSARSTTKLTRSGSELGSLPWMAPELLRDGMRSVDARSDVYALGVILYELLTLRSPFAAADHELTRRNILAGAPRRPGEWNASVPWDAETVCLTAMDVDPARRYATAAAFARDLDNVLALRPIEARRAGPALRTRRWIQRHPTLTVAAGAAALVVFVLPTLLWLQAQSDKGKIEAQRDAARVNYGYALGAIDVFVSKVGNVRLAHVPQMEHLRRAMLGEALRFYQQLIDRGHDDAFLRREMALAGSKLVGIELLLDQKESAKARAVDRIRALELQREKEPADGDVRCALGIAWSDLGLEQERRDALADAEASYRKSIVLLRGAIAPRSDDPTAERFLAHACGSLALVCTRENRVGEAIVAGREAAKVLDELLPRFPDDFGSRLELGRTLNELGTALEFENRIAEADEAYRRAERELARCLQYFKDDEDYQQYYAVALNHLATLRLRTGDFAAAEERGRAAVAIRTGLATDYPAVTDYRWDLGESLFDYGLTLRALDRRDEARATFERARGVQQALVDADPGRVGYRSELAATLGSQADLLREAGDLAGAAALVQKAIDHQALCLKTTPDDPDCLRFMLQHQIVLGSVLGEMKEYRGAIAAFRAGLESGGRQRRDLRLLAVACGQALARLGDDADLEEGALQDCSRELVALAIAVAERLVRDGDESKATLLAAPDLAPLRERDEFREWLQRK